MKILTIAGTRPELIRLSVIIKKLDKILNGPDSDSLSKHIFVWTGQNYTPELKDIFFKELGIREPDYSNHGGWDGLSNQLGDIFKLVEKAIGEWVPDKALILGDTNSALSTLICERLGVPVYHMEAGNRCHDMKVPEEVNRRNIDHTASYALPYTPGATENLLKEGIPRERIFECGNPIYEVMMSVGADIRKGHPGEDYFLATFHRQENVDDPDRLKKIIKSLHMVADKYGAKMICSVHPRTKSRLEMFEIEVDNNLVELMMPVGFREFLELERCAKGVLTDSGTVQEECCLFHVPTVTIRDSTERPETVECGSNLVSGLEPESVLACMEEMLRRSGNWHAPGSYVIPNVSEKVLEILNVR